MKIDDILSQPFPENIQKVVDWLELQEKDSVFSCAEIEAQTGVDHRIVEQSAYLEGRCVEYPLGCEWYGGKSAIKLFRRKHKEKFGKKVL